MHFLVSDIVHQDRSPSHLLCAFYLGSYPQFSKPTTEFRWRFSQISVNFLVTIATGRLDPWCLWPARFRDWSVIGNIAMSLSHSLLRLNWNHVHHCLLSYFICAISYSDRILICIYSKRYNENSAWFVVLCFAFYIHIFSEITWLFTRSLPLWHCVSEVTPKNANKIDGHLTKKHGAKHVDYFEVHSFPEWFVPIMCWFRIQTIVESSMVYIYGK